MSVDVAAPELVAPAHLWLPEGAAGEAAREALDLAAEVGLDLDPEQQLMVGVYLAEQEDGTPVLETAAVEPRQNGKTVGLQAAALHDMFLTDDKLLIWTAHLFPTAQEAFRDLDALIEGSSWLSRRVRTVSRANGEEGIGLHSGCRLLFRARSKTGGRGLTGDKVILDEAFALEPSHMGALIPTLSTRRSAQIRYASSAGLLHSAILRGIRDRGRPGNDPTLAYVEWGAEDVSCARDGCDHRLGQPGCGYDDEEAWVRANPATQRGRITVDFIRAERRALPPGEFARERLGHWEDPVIGTDLDLASWGELTQANAAPDDPVVFGLDVAPGSVSASVVACGLDVRPAEDPDDPRCPVVEVVESRRAASWLVGVAVELRDSFPAAQFWLDPAGPVGALLPDLQTAGVDVELLDGRSAAQAAGALAAAVAEGRILHRGQAELTAAVAAARRRPVGDAWKWSRRDSTADISPLVAATAAHWGWLSTQGDEYSVADSIY